MKNRIVLKFFGAFAVLTLIIVFVLNFFVSLKLSNHFEQKISAELKSNAVLVADILEEDLAEGRLEEIQLNGHRQSPSNASAIRPAVS